MAVAPLTLIRGDAATLDYYRAAVKRGWSADSSRGAEGAPDELARIARDPAAFLAALDDPAGTAGPVRMPDGSTRPRLPGLVRWMWDGDVAGSIGLRWQPGTEALPDYVLGHIGFSVVPWRRGRGYAATAVRLILPLARAQGLRWVELTADVDNMASRRSIERAGGALVDLFGKPPVQGGGSAARYRIAL